MDRKDEQWTRIAALFHRAVGRKGASRDRFLAEHCGTDEELRRQLTSLLDADDAVHGTWPGLANGDSATHPPDAPPAIAGYEIAKTLGRGGMGTVYLAHRHDAVFDGRAFAIKVLHRHRSSASGLRRFDLERQLLAGLDHPNIVRLFDGGVLDDGRPYLVVDHIEGQPLDAFCRRRRLTVASRLALFRTICGALHAAHQSGIIHRDLKPSNILVDAEGVPHLLDFGIAKRLRPPATAGDARAPRTTVEWAVPLTPAYASPEQRQGAPVTVASDLYSAGVLLFEMLTGRLPGPKDDPRPSAATPESASAAATWRTTPARLRRRLRGDLDHIVAKALRAEPSARYASAREMAEDLERHLAHRPVLARRGTWRYLGGRFLRRHRVGLSIAGSVLVAAVFAIVLGVQSRRLDAARAEGAESLRLIRQLVGPETDLLMGEADLDRAVSEIVALDARDPDRMLLFDIVRRMHLPEDRLVDRAAELSRRTLASGAADEGWAYVSRVVGELVYHNGRFEAAEAILRASVGLAETTYGGDDIRLAPHLEAHAKVLSELERYAEGVALLNRSVALRSAEPSTLASVEPLSSLAYLYHAQGAYPDAVSAGRRALAILDREEGGDAATRASVLTSLSVALMEIDARDPRGEAEALAREALALNVAVHGPAHLESVIARHNLAAVLGRAGRVEESLTISLANLRHAEAALGRDHPRLGHILSGIAVSHRHLDRPDACVAYARRAVKLRAGLPPDNWQTAISMTRLADCLGILGKNEEAIDLLRASIEIFEASGVVDGSYLAFARSRLAELMLLLPANSRVPD